MTAPRIVLFGDSHAYAIQRAIERREAKGCPVVLTAHRLLKTKNDVVMGDTSFEDFLTMAGKLGPQDIVLSVIGGNQHAVFSTIQHPQPFTFVEPGEVAPAIPSGTEIIPYRALAAYFASGIRGRDGKSLEALRKATTARVIHMAAPPPKRDNAHIMRHHEIRFAQDNIAALGVSAPELRLKFWRLQTCVLAEVCAELGIEIMLPPAQTLDKDGYLAPEFYANDATHANVTFGERLVDAIEQQFGPQTQQGQVP